MSKEMTLKEAIRILNPETTREALTEYEYYGGFNGKQAMIKAVEQASILACEAMKFKEYFDELYGEGLEVANWHLNGELEPFDNFYESALEDR